MKSVYNINTCKWDQLGSSLSSSDACKLIFIALIGCIHEQLLIFPGRRNLLFWQFESRPLASMKFACDVNTYEHPCPPVMLISLFSALSR